MEDDYATNSYYSTYTFLLKWLGECTFLNLGVKGLKGWEKTRLDTSSSTCAAAIFKAVLGWRFVLECYNKRHLFSKIFRLYLLYSSLCPDTSSYGSCNTISSPYFKMAVTRWASTQNVSRTQESSNGGYMGVHTSHSFCKWLIEFSSSPVPHPCHVRPCLNGGVCIDSYSGYNSYPEHWDHGFLHYLCLCQSGFIGPNCEGADSVLFYHTGIAAHIARQIVCGMCHVTCQRLCVSWSPSMALWPARYLFVGTQFQVQLCLAGER